MVVKFSSHAESQSFQLAEASVVITTDALKTGFGGFMNEEIFQGNWTNAQSKRHIHCLEMEAVYLTVKHFLPQIKGQTILVRSDNSTVVRYLSMQVGNFVIKLVIFGI